MNSKHKNTSVLLSEDIKPWLYRKLHVENRSLSNYLNTILKREKDREEGHLITPINISIEALRSWLKEDKHNTQ